MIAKKTPVAHTSVSERENRRLGLVGALLPSGISPWNKNGVRIQEKRLLKDIFWMPRTLKDEITHCIQDRKPSFLRVPVGEGKMISPNIGYVNITRVL